MKKTMNFAAQNVHNYRFRWNVTTWIHYYWSINYRSWLVFGVIFLIFKKKACLEVVLEKSTESVILTIDEEKMNFAAQNVHNYRFRWNATTWIHYYWSINFPSWLVFGVIFLIFIKKRLWKYYWKIVQKA